MLHSVGTHMHYPLHNQLNRISQMHKTKQTLQTECMEPTLHINETKEAGAAWN
jgi:hypothetical protein